MKPRLAALLVTMLLCSAYAEPRLAVSDAATNQISILDAHDGTLLGSFTVPGASGGTLTVSGGGQHLIATHRDANRVSIIHSGLFVEDHGDHGHLHASAPHVLATVNTGLRPGHVTVAGQQLLVFHDGDGSVALLDENLFGLSLNYRLSEGAGPDHGSAELLDGYMMTGVSQSGVVTVRELATGDSVASFECPAAHGSISVAGQVLFGCQDAVLLLDAGLNARYVPVPDGARVGTFYAEADGIAIGNSGSGLALIDTVTAELHTVPLPATPRAAAFTDSGLVVLDADGSVHLLQLTDGQALLVHSLSGLVGTEHPAGRPALAVWHDDVWVSDPGSGQVQRLSSAAGELQPVAVFETGGNPAGLGLLMPAGDFSEHH